MQVQILDALAALARTRSQRDRESWTAACDYAARELVLGQPSSARTALVATYQAMQEREAERVREKA